MSILFDLHSGKNAKWPYFLRAIAREMWPAQRADIERIVREAKARPDWPMIRERVNYLCKLDPLHIDLGDSAKPWSEIRKGNGCHSTYYYDIRQWMRPFRPETRINFLPGDVTQVPAVPSLTKSRPVAGDNANSVLLRLNQVRHFIWVNDTTPYHLKRPQAIFRGKVPGKPKRELLFTKYFSNQVINLGDTDRNGLEQWRAPRMTIPQQLQYKWILAIEGNDVASNLKWIMSSQSVAVMPRPEYETWFMEGRLKPDVHYLEVAPDIYDLPDRLQWLDAHPDTAQRIIRAANEYTTQFRNAKLERLISTLVIAKYLSTPENPINI